MEGTDFRKANASNSYEEIQMKNPCEECIVKAMCKRTCYRHTKSIKEFLGDTKFPGLSIEIVANMVRQCEGGSIDLVDSNHAGWSMEILGGSIVGVSDWLWWKERKDKYK